MNSSGAVFTRQNPFPPESLLPRAHYSPSRTKNISRQQKKLALSPVRFGHVSSPPESPHVASLDRKDLNFQEKSNHTVPCSRLPIQGNGSYSESWPSTDLGSSDHIAGVCPQTESHQQASQPQHSFTTVTSKMEELSVLAKYVDRFRYGKPQSREERKRLAAAGVDGQSVWRLSTSSPKPSGSTSRRTSEERSRGSFNSKSDETDLQRSFGELRRIHSLSSNRDHFDLSVLSVSESSYCESEGPELLHLLEGASRLVQKRHVENLCEGSLSSGYGVVPISSEGLGCSDLTTPVSVDELIRKPLVPNYKDSSWLLTTPCLPGRDSLPAPSTLDSQRSHSHPGDDILFQWRLRRNMQQERLWSQTPSHGSDFQHSALSRVSQQMEPSLFSADFPQSASLSFTPAPVDIVGSVITPNDGTVPVPTILMSNSATYKLRPNNVKQTTCCPCVRFPQQYHEIRDTGESRDTVSSPQACLCGQGRPSTNSAVAHAEQQSMCPTSSSSSPSPSQSLERECHRCQCGGMQVQDKKEKRKGGKKVMSSSQKKKTERHAGNDDPVKDHQRSAKANRQPGRGQEGANHNTKESTRKNKWHSGVKNSAGLSQMEVLAPAPSPIHNTLGQAVSEVLFPDSNSPTLSKGSCSSASPRSSPPAPPPPQSSTPPRQTLQQPHEVIDQLMQEAQDSDGLEFEDDPLLLVLREQRQWVKEQLCEVDMLLDELYED